MYASCHQVKYIHLPFLATLRSIKTAIFSKFWRVTFTDCKYFPFWQPSEAEYCQKWQKGDWAFIEWQINSIEYKIELHICTYTYTQQLHCLSAPMALCYWFEVMQSYEAPGHPFNISWQRFQKVPQVIVTIMLASFTWIVNHISSEHSICCGPLSLGRPCWMFSWLTAWNHKYLPYDRSCQKWLHICRLTEVAKDSNKWLHDIAKNGNLTL